MKTHPGRLKPPTKRPIRASRRYWATILDADNNFVKSILISASHRTGALKRVRNYLKRLKFTIFLATG